MPRIRRTITETIDLPKDMMVDLEALIDEGGGYALVANPDDDDDYDDLDEDEDDE